MQNCIRREIKSVTSRLSRRVRIMTNFNTQPIDDNSNEDGVQGIIDEMNDIEINDELEFAPVPVRTLPEIRMSKAQFSRQMRFKLSVKEKLAMIKEATTGLEVKMGKIDHESINGANDEQLENNVEVETFLYRMEKHLRKFDMAKIFEQFPILDRGEIGANRWRSRKTVNLLKMWDQIIRIHGTERYGDTDGLLPEWDDPVPFQREISTPDELDVSSESDGDDEELAQDHHSEEPDGGTILDGDFAGLWGHELPTDVHAAKSRTGYVILLNNCPILWTSKLQQLIATSTMHAEYVALSTACRDVIPLRELVLELSNVYNLPTDKPTIKSTVYEDNEGALRLANTELPRTTPRSKHYGIIYHWFREHVSNGTIEVVPIKTENQLADIFTKGLPWRSFEKLRKHLMGW